MFSVPHFSFAGIVEEFIEKNDMAGLEEYCEVHFYSLSSKEAELAHKAIINDYIKKQDIRGLEEYADFNVSRYSPSYEVAFITIIDYIISKVHESKTVENKKEYEKELIRFLNEARVPRDSGAYKYVKYAKGFLTHRFKSVSNCASYLSGIQSIDQEITKINQFWY